MSAPLSDHDPVFTPEMLYECEVCQPERSEVVRLFFHDGAMAYGWWDGLHWRIKTLPVHPDYWQPLAHD